MENCWRTDGELMENCQYLNNLDSISSFPTFDQSHNQLNQSKHRDKQQDDAYSNNMQLLFQKLSSTDKIKMEIIFQTPTL